MCDAAERAGLGARGEDMAVRYYKSRGYRILARNFRTRQGEIDVVTQKGEMLVFAEVKTRSAGMLAAPREFVTAAKQRRLIQAARGYLSRYGGECRIRFDVVEVFVPREGKPLLRCIENAFTL